jgi:hypothetical protein
MALAMADVDLLDRNQRRADQAGAAFWCALGVKPCWPTWMPTRGAFNGADKLKGAGMRWSRSRCPAGGPEQRGLISIALYS